MTQAQLSTEATTTVSAAAADVVAKVKRQVSPEATAALALHRERATLGINLLAVLEAGASGNLETLKPLAEKHAAEVAAAKAAEAAERKANAGVPGAALAEYRAKTADAMMLLQHLKDTGIDVDAALAAAKAKQAV